MAPRSPEEISLDSAPRRRDDVTSVELDGEAVLYADGAMHRLDPIGTVLWHCFDGETTLAELVDDLVAEFRTDREQIAHDVVGFTRRMGEDGLLAGIHHDG